MYILGAGLSGCIAAILYPQAIVLEAAASPPDNHSAVLRFRSDKISKVTGIPFRKVSVSKTIYWEGKHHHQVSPDHANLYSQKVTGKVLSRSISNLDTVDRFIAPENLQERLLEGIGSRVQYEQKICEIDTGKIYSLEGRYGKTFLRDGCPIISTLPMPVIAKITGHVIEAEFTFKPIHTAKVQVANCDVFQTIYFPEPNLGIYRATLTGDTLILEGTRRVTDWEIAHALEAFGIHQNVSAPIAGSQKYGKIAPVPDPIRKAFMFDLTTKLGIYSLGRFAVWRNILLDDVYEDVFAIRRMLEQSHYDIKKGMHK